MIFQNLNRKILNIYGPDAEQLLQSLITNDIKQTVARPISLYQYMIDNTGRYLCDSFIWRSNNDLSFFWVDISHQGCEVFVSRLNTYKLRRNISIQDVSNDYCILYSHTPITSKGAIVSAQDPRYEKLGYRTIIEKNSILALSGQEAMIYDKDKYNYCIPDGEVDLEYQRSMIVQFGAEELNAISYSKGCYVGQEVVSRAKYQGTIRKRLYLAIGEDDHNVVMSKGADIIFKNEVIGRVCSNYGNMAICLLKSSDNEPVNASVSIEGAKFITHSPPWRC